MRAPRGGAGGGGDAYGWREKRPVPRAVPPRLPSTRTAWRLARSMHHGLGYPVPANRRPLPTDCSENLSYPSALYTTLVFSKAHRIVRRTAATA
jgi:hypothetical protein